MREVFSRAYPSPFAPCTETVAEVGIEYEYEYRDAEYEYENP